MHQLPFAPLMDQNPAATLCLDKDWRILYANPSAATLLEQTPDQLIGQDFRASWCPHVGDHPTPWEVDFQIEGRSPKYLQCHINPSIGDECAPVGYMAALCDRTDFYQVNEERDRLMEMATISEILPGILHEFKNPLASIQALVELMTEDCDDDDLQGQLHGILMEIRRMKLSFEGLGSTTRNLASTRNQAVDFGIREACAIFSRQLKAQGVKMITDIDTLPLLPLDSGGIRGILFNLLNNAKQACRRGDEIEVRSALTDDGTSFFFTVRDTGKGMSPEVLKQCTDLFFTTKRMGSGIGLALCRTAVEKIGGRIQVESVEGRGTQFSVFLPLNLSKGVVNESR